MERAPLSARAARSGEPLRTIHVGVGTRGKVHLWAALESGYCRPVALVDVVPAYLAAAREMTGLPESACFARLEDALAAVDSDAVVVASPVTLHAGHILAGLAGNRHVLTEKCFTVGLAGAEQCVAEAQRRDRKLMVVQNSRLSPAVRTLRRLTAEQRYGKLGLFTMSFFKARRRPYNRSPHMHLWQQGVHELDTMLSVVQRPLRRVWGLSNNPTWCDWPSASTVQAICEFDGGISGTHVSTSNARAAGYEFRLECADAALISTDRHAGTVQVRWHGHNKGDEQLEVDTPDVRGLEHVPLAEAVLAGAAVAKEAYRLQDLQIYRNFYEYVREGVEPESSGQRNLDTIRFVEAVQRSSELGRPVNLSEVA